MLKSLICVACCTVASFAAQAVDVNVNIGNLRLEAPGVSVSFGSRNDRGYYWDGYEYRDPDYWRRHDGHRGEKYYTGRGKGVPHQGGGHCPPGQAKKGNC